MLAVVTRVSSAYVDISGRRVAEIGRGLLVLLGVVEGDCDEDAAWLARKICALRIFSDDADKLNLSLSDVGGGMIVVSNFTLAADCRKGNRPSFIAAAGPEEANRLYELFCACCCETAPDVQTGVFRADMAVGSVNDGPITIPLDSSVRKDARRSREV